MRAIKYFRFLICVQLWILLVFSAFRLVLLFMEREQLACLKSGAAGIWKALAIGVWFDHVIACYLLILPLFLGVLSQIFRFDSTWLRRFIVLYYALLLPLCFFISAADVPYFHQFGSRFSASVLNYADNLSIVVGMILEDLRLLIYLIPLVLVIWGNWRMLRYFATKTLAPVGYGSLEKSGWRHGAEQTLLGLFALGLCVLGGRGSLDSYSPIRLSDAYFSDCGFVNQLGLNPVFNFMQSYIDGNKAENREFRWMSDEEALRQSAQYLGITDGSSLPSPIARKVSADGPERRLNVVIVLVESLSADYLARYGNKENLTPFLDSLATQSLCFDHFYSSGIHTYNGIYSSLYGFPGILRQHPMKNQAALPPFKGLPVNLKNAGYQTCFFTTHEERFDNMAGFLRANGFDRVVGLHDYDPAKVITAFGVADESLFELGMRMTDSMARSEKPFLATFLTISNHPPFTLPPAYKPRVPGAEQAAVAYTDDCIRHFMQEAAKKPWFDQSIFVFLGDHGRIIGTSPYDMPLSYHHIPLLIYAPKTLAPAAVQNMGGQLDLFPTLMGLLNQNYVNNSLGVNLLKERRPYIFSNADDKIGCLDKDFFFEWRKDGNASLYRYGAKDSKDYLKDFPAKADSMQRYMFANMQAAQWMLKWWKI